MPSLMRAVIDALLPRGPVWRPAPGLDMDLFHEGLGDSLETSRSDVKVLEDLRNPAKTVDLDTLEAEFGVANDTGLPQATRRGRLGAKMYPQYEGGTITQLQDALDRAGFVVEVHANDPAVDPALFLDQAFQLVAEGGVNAYAGDPDAYAGRSGGYLLVNGDIYTNVLGYWCAAGSAPYAYAGDPKAVSGGFDTGTRSLIEYPIPVDPGSWPFVFFVGGPATRYPVTNELTFIETASVPFERQLEFKRTILAIMPMHAWAGLIVTFD